MQAGNNANAMGVDVSEWQGRPDWRAVRADGKVFALARATYGAHYEDASFAYNWPHIKAAGLLRGAYHVAVPGQVSTDPLTDAQHQAAVFLAVLDRYGGITGGDLPPALDLELNPHGWASAAVMEWALKWLDSVDAAVHNPRQAAMVYSYPAFLARFPARSALSRRALWIADDNPAGAPADVAGWTRWTCWQYWDRGTVSGIAGPVDLDEWCVDPSALRAEYGGQAETSPPDASGPKVMVWFGPDDRQNAVLLAAQFGWQATHDLTRLKTASEVLCIGGTPAWLHQVQAAVGPTTLFRTPLAGSTYWETTLKVCNAAIRGEL
jgi:lysozyme